MKKFAIEKAGDTPGRPPVEDVFISIHSTGVFEETNISSASICANDAEDLHDVLRASLPQATFNRLAGLMLKTCAGEMIRAYEPAPETKEK